MVFDLKACNLATEYKKNGDCPFCTISKKQFHCSKGNDKDLDFLGYAFPFLFCALHAKQRIVEIMLT